MRTMACATLCAEGFGFSAFEKTAEMIPAAGYTWIECNLWHPESMLPATVELMIEKCSGAGLKFASIYGRGIGGWPGSEDIDLAHKLRLLDIAARVGAGLIVFGGTPRSRGGTLESIITMLNHLAPLAAESGIRIGLENHAGFTIETIDDYAAVFDGVPHENVGICIDTGHFDAANVDMTALIERFSARVNHLHVKENNGKGAVDFRRFGEGTTDNAAVIEKLVEKDYTGFITVEISPPKDRPNEVDDLKKPREMFQKYCVGE